MLSKSATSHDGYCYEDKMYKKLINIFLKENIIREHEISQILHSYKPQTEKSQLLGIDFIIRAKCNGILTLFAIQVKIGAKKRNISHVIPFVRTLWVLRKLVSEDKSHAFYGFKIVPIWLSSAGLDEPAKKLLFNNFISCFIDSAWSIDIDNCPLFTKFINGLLIKDIT